MFYTLMKHGFFDQSEHAQGPVYVLKGFIRDFLQDIHGRS